MFNISKQFVEKLIQKDQQAFNEFYNISVEVFFRFLKSNYFVSDKEAEDIVADFYFKLRNNIVSYKKEYNFETWVWTVFRNTIKDSFKKQSYRYFSSYSRDDKDIDFSETIPSEEDILEFLEKDFEYQKIQTAIKTLEDKFKEIIDLKFVQQLSNDEIAKVLNISNSNVRQRISRALKKLKEKLEN